MKREFTCIVCPIGCNIEVVYDGDIIESIKGNTCKRGADYATNEITSPVRTVTTTVRCENGAVVAVKTDKPIPKDKIFECMEQVNKVNAVLPINMGDVIISNVAGTDANIIATAEVE